MKKFKITYINPDTQEEEEVIQSFEDTQTVTAEEWAEDYAYSLADKGPHTVEVIK